jgi:hypothetical protein
MYKIKTNSIAIVNKDGSVIKMNFDDEVTILTQYSEVNNNLIRERTQRIIEIENQLIDFVQNHPDVFQLGELVKKFRILHPNLEMNDVEIAMGSLLNKGFILLDNELNIQIKK